MCTTTENTHRGCEPPEAPEKVQRTFKLAHTTANMWKTSTMTAKASGKRMPAGAGALCEHERKPNRRRGTTMESTAATAK